MEAVSEPSFYTYPGPDEDELPLKDDDDNIFKSTTPMEVKKRCLVSRLPSDAWEKWCKDGVICFAIESPEVLKVFFADPRDFSVYHVTDFDCMKYFGMKQRPRLLNCVLLGSKIYIIGCPSCFGRRPVFYWDVATAATQQRSDDYHWVIGPRLNSSKPLPYAFALDGKLYVISSPGTEYWGFEPDLHSYYPFEVLDDPDSDGDGWKVLGSPASWWTRLDIQRVFWSSVIGDSKILLFDGCDNCCHMYDAKSGEWKMISKPSDDHPFYEWSFLGSSFRLFENANGVVLDPKGRNFVIDFLSKDFEYLPIHDSKCLHYRDIFEGTSLEVLHWSLFQLKDKKYLFILGFTDSVRKCYVALGTFDLGDGCDVSDAAKHCEMDADSSDDDPKRLKMTEYRLLNLEARSIPLTDGAIPFTHCVVNCKLLPSNLSIT